MLTLTRSTLKRILEMECGRNDQPVLIKSNDPDRHGYHPVASIKTARMVMDYYGPGTYETYENFLIIEAGKHPRDRVKHPEIRWCIVQTTDENEGNIFPAPSIGMLASSD